jgi:hypothetical protein
MCGKRPRIAAALLCLISALLVTDLPCGAAESPAPTGTLRIDGAGVQRLQLIDSDGKKHSVEVVDGIVTLDPSTYTVTRIYLTNGLYSGSNGPAKHLTVEVTAEAETTLKVGGPLKQRIEAKRQGCMLVMSSFTEGVGGIRYAGRPAGGEAPGFEVYKADRKIADGQFEYG